MPAEIRVTVWNEFRHEKLHDAVKAVYPDGIHVALAEALAAEPDMTVRTATLDEPAHGLSDDVLAATDVMLWWGHMAHNEVADEIVAKVRKRVLEGMGLVVLHSGHFSKVFKALMGTTCSLCWREEGEREVLWVTDPSHPIAAGINTRIILQQTEMYGEPFGVPVPDEQVFISSFAGGEVFRSGNVWRRGAGTIFYFRPGHETYPLFRNEQVLRVITNAVRYVRPTGEPIVDAAPNRKMGWFEKLDA